jgi:Family of unknown function (DUF6636)
MIMAAPKGATLALVVSTVAAAIALPATARADSQYFQSPSGNIYCVLDGGGVACDVHDYTYQPPPPPECGKHLPWGNRFSLTAGEPAVIECHGDTLRVPVGHDVHRRRLRALLPGVARLLQPRLTTLSGRA